MYLQPSNSGSGGRKSMNQIQTTLHQKSVSSVSNSVQMYTESSRLEEIFKVTESNHPLSTATVMSKPLNHIIQHQIQVHLEHLH